MVSSPLVARRYTRQFALPRVGRIDRAAFSVTIRKKHSGEDFVKPAPFAYTKARTLKEAVALLSKHKGDARLLAGGQSLIATLNMRLSAPDLLIDINGIKGLDGIARKGKIVEIGALARHTQVERSAVIAKHAPLIARAMPHIGHPAIRNRGTFGGSIAFADPAAELPACLLALGAEIEIAGPKGKRKVMADAFFKGLFETALKPREVLTAVRVPAADKNSRVGFAELARRHGDYAMVGLAACARAASKGLTDVRLAFFGVGATPMRAKKSEAALASGNVDAAVAALDLDPDDDVQASGAVKKHLAGVLLRRVAKQLMERQA
jgi:aerobic carbon-monoxide dehydrogenase medium subunit